jgi:hypothetical protein
LTLDQGFCCAEQFDCDGGDLEICANCELNPKKDKDETKEEKD